MPLFRSPWAASLLIFTWGCASAGSSEPPDIPVPVAGASGPTRETPAPTPTSPPSPTPVPAPSPHLGTRALVFGDSLTDDAFRTSVENIDAEGVPGATTVSAERTLDTVLARHPEAGTVGLAFGTNDAFLGGTPEEYHARLERLVQRLLAEGRRPLLATVAYGPHIRLERLPEFNAAVRAIEAKYGLAPGPDLYAWFLAHPEQIQSDRVHMTESGNNEIRRLWAEAFAEATP